VNADEAAAPEDRRYEDQVPAQSVPGYVEAPTAVGRYGYVLLDVTSGPPTLYSAADVVADKAEAKAWADEVNASPPMTPWGPLRVAVAALVAVAS